MCGQDGKVTMCMCNVLLLTLSHRHRPTSRHPHIMFLYIIKDFYFIRDALFILNCHVGTKEEQTNNLQQRDNNIANVKKYSNEKAE